MVMGSSLRIGSVLLAGVLLLTGCAAVTLEKDLNLTPELFARRQAQTRRFDTADEQRILRACAALLQDTGFTIDESEARLGVLTASKERDATDAMQVAARLALAMVGISLPPDKDQVMRAFVTTRPAGPDGRQTAVRVVFERFVFDTDGRLTKIEALDDTMIYRSFFEKLAKALFLEAHDF